MLFFCRTVCTNLRLYCLITLTPWCRNFGKCEDFSLRQLLESCTEIFSCRLGGGRLFGIRQSLQLVKLRYASALLRFSSYSLSSGQGNAFPSSCKSLWYLALGTRLARRQAFFIRESSRWTSRTECIPKPTSKETFPALHTF